MILAGGQQYRRVMRAALTRRYGVLPPLLQETEGGIGMQRSQLGAFLDGLASPFSEPFGEHPNGTPLYRRYGWIEPAPSLTSFIELRHPSPPVKLVCSRCSRDRAARPPMSRWRRSSAATRRFPRDGSA